MQCPGIRNPNEWESFEGFDPSARQEGKLGGVTTEVCVHTTVREANDRGYECLVLGDCVGSYFPEFQRVALDMIKAQGGIFGWVGTSADAIGALEGCRR